MDEDRERHIASQKAKAASKGKAVAKNASASRPGRGRKRIRIESDDSSDSEAGGSKRKKKDDGQAQLQGNDEEEAPMFQQPASITGAKLKDYQLEGLQWMVSLDQNGISGILGQLLFLPMGAITQWSLHSRRNGSREGETRSN
jgi:ATP-dependent DNA helicase